MSNESAVHRISMFSDRFVRGMCDILAQTGPPGLTGSEIDHLLQSVHALPRDSALNKRHSLFAALMESQQRQHAGNVVSAFLARAMSPDRFVGDPQRFDDLRDQLNEFFIFHDRCVNEQGKLAPAKSASTLREAAALAGRLQTELRRRQVHAELLKYCDEELIAKSLFHATTEAAKSIPSRVRQISRLAGDGAAIYDGVFGSGRERPLWSINTMSTEYEVSEHRGFKNLLIGIHGHFRNPRAHTARIDDLESINDFYDAFSLFSYVHRRLDSLRRIEST